MKFYFWELSVVVQNIWSFKSVTLQIGDAII